MTSAVVLHSKDEIQRCLKGNVYLHIYSIGDLDDFFWPYTVWFAQRSEGECAAIALLYISRPLPTLLALTENPGPMKTLLRSVEHALPPHFNAHLSPGVESVFGSGYDVSSHGEHYKMALPDNGAVAQCDCSGVCSLSMADLDEVIEFYEHSYPGNWFDPRMLDTGQYYGVRDAGTLVSIAGVHVYSLQYRVAALGNIATSPERRSEGLGGLTTARVCQSLSETVDYIGLNVKADNQAAIACYRRLGFDIVASYGEFSIKRSR